MGGLVRPAGTRRSARLLFARDARRDGGVPAGARRARPTRRRRSASRSSPRWRRAASRVERAGARAAASRGRDRCATPRELAAARFDRALDRALAADVVQRHHRRRARAARGQRARGGGRRRRARGRGRRRSRAGAATPRCARRRRCSATCPVGARGRHVRAPRARGDRLRRGRPRRRAGRARRRASRPRRPADIGDPGRATAGLRAALETPLGPLLGGARLRDVARADRLDELDFELPLAGGDAPDRAARRSTRSPPSCAPHLPPGDPLAGYADRLADPALRASVRGYLTGSIDLVARRGRSLRGRRLQDQLARRARRAADRLAPPPGGARRRDGARALRAAGAALHGRAAPLPALAAAGLRPRAQPRRRALPVPARDDRAGDAGGRRRAVRRVRLAAARARSSSRSATCSTGAAA